MTSPLVTAIVPAYNAETFICETLKSIRSQSFSDFECLVINDASSDQTAELVQRDVSDDNRFRLLTQAANKGPGAARNRGIDEARGLYIAFLDSDDLWREDKLDIQTRHMSETPFSFTPYKIIDRHGRERSHVDVSTPRSVGYLDMLKKSATLGCSTVMLARDFIGDRRFPDIPRGQDYAFWLQLLSDGTRAHRTEDVLTSYRINPAGISRNKLRKARDQWSIYRKLRHVGPLKSTYYMGYYAKNAIFRR